RRGLSDGLCKNFHHRKTSTSIRAAPRRVLESLIHTLNYEEPPMPRMMAAVAPMRTMLEMFMG
ncbi:hypothetical protein, partial [Auritidibacter sp. NML100628]|uniref:hypothetical protein n=1 Tax=Auritidibacter sp. NML100628 TaxID=2170742 RepID=UPI001F29020E